MRADKYLYDVISIITDVGLGRSRMPVDIEPLPRSAERAADDGKFGGGSGKLLALARVSSPLSFFYEFRNSML